MAAEVALTDMTQMRKDDVRRERRQSYRIPGVAGIASAAVRAFTASCGTAAPLRSLRAGDHHLPARLPSALPSSKRQAMAARLAAAGDDWSSRLDAIFDQALTTAADPGFRGCPFQLAMTEGAELDGAGAAVCHSQDQWRRGLIAECVNGLAPGAPPVLAEAVALLRDAALSQNSSAAAVPALGAARWAVAQLIGAAWENRRAG
jgi:hypothetical protein